jgi:hypothetical protein
MAEVGQRRTGNGELPGRVVQLEQEIRVAQTIGEQTHAYQSGAGKSRFDDPFHDACGQRTARFRPNPASFIGSAGNHRSIVLRSGVETDTPWWSMIESAFFEHEHGRNKAGYA